MRAWEFRNKGYFKYAIQGVYIGQYENKRQVIPPSFAPSAEVFFTTKLQSKKVYPIYEFYEYYNEEMKRKAINNILADILENVREELKNLFNKE